MCLVRYEIYDLFLFALNRIYGFVCFVLFFETTEKGALKFVEVEK